MKKEILLLDDREHLKDLFNKQEEAKNQILW
jgi:hypothetical protein